VTSDVGVAVCNTVTHLQVSDGRCAMFALIGGRMSNAREILDGRLAKGEISIDEYKTLVAAIGVSPTPPAVEAATPSVAASLEAKPSKTQSNLIALGILAFILLGMGFWNRSSDVERGRVQCMSQHNNASLCSCIMNEMHNRVSVLYFTIPFKWFVTDIPQSIEREVANACVRR